MADGAARANKPADRWDELVKGGMSPEVATATVTQEYGPPRQTLLGRAAQAFTTPVAPAPKPMGSVEATFRAAAAAPASVEMATAAKTREANKPTLASTAGSLFVNNIPSFLMPQRTAEDNQRILDAAAQAGVDVGQHANLLGAMAAGGDVAGNVLLNKAIPGTAPLAKGMTAPQVVGNLGKAAAMNYGVGAGLTKLAGGTNADANRAGLIQGGLGTALHGLAGSPVLRGLFPRNESGTGAVPLMSSIVGAGTGGSVGYATGTTPEDKRKRAIIGALAGAAVGGGLGAAAERIGAKNVTPEPLPPKGNTPAEEYAKLSTFALDPTGEARLRDALERAGPITRGDPKTVEPHATVRLVAKSLGVEDVMRGDATRLNRNELLAIRNIVHTNIDDITQAVNRLQSDATLPAAERAKLAEAIQGMEQQNVHLLDRFTTARGEMGRNLNALKVLASRTLDPVVWLSKAQAMRGALGVPDELRSTILRYIGEGNREKLVKTLMDARGSTPWEKVQTFWSANLLSNPATHVVNVTSNAALGGMEQIKQAPAAFADHLMAMATDQHTTAGWTRSMASASKEGARRGFAAAVNTIKTGMDPATMGKYDIPRQTNYANPILQVYTESIFRTLGAEDQVFREMALSSSLANQAEVMAKTEGWKGEVRRARVAELRSAPSDEMVLRAIADAEEATVRDRTSAGTVLRHMNQFAPQGIPVGKFVVPFTRTPGAVATRIAEYSPAGLAVGSYKTARVILKGLRGQEVPHDVQRYAAKLFGRGATGTALTALGYYLASKGLATGPNKSGGKDWATSSVTGQTPTSVKVGDYWWETGRINPVGNLLSLGARIYEMHQGGAGVAANAAQVPLTVVQTVADQPFLLGLQRALQDIQAPQLAIGQFTKGVVAGFIPASAALSAVARGMDPTLRQATNLTDYLKSRLPVDSKTLAPSIDALGQPKQRVGGVAEQLVSPVRRSEDQSQDPVIRAMLENDIQVSDLKRAKGESPEAFAARAISEGLGARKAIERLLQTQRWQQADQATRQQMFARDFAYGRLRGAPRPTRK